MLGKIVKWSNDKKWMGKVVHSFIYSGEIYHVVDTSYGEKKSVHGLIIMRSSPNLMSKDSRGQNVDVQA